ncbi:MAG: hypothetical protein D6743_15850 [Calditrichaeota bacterium]|nr:MAG: hypothetical protein D6743_15850 [Calditrichota bacterium]
MIRLCSRIAVFVVLLGVVFPISLVGCSSKEELPEKKPAPEASDPGYQQYQNGGRFGPSSDQGKKDGGDKAKSGQ